MCSSRFPAAANAVSFILHMTTDNIIHRLKGFKTYYVLFPSNNSKDLAGIKEKGGGSLRRPKGESSIPAIRQDRN
jgi:hypothetical protein